jgi:hypothetical protein
MEPVLMSPDEANRQGLLLLVHDVGKYIARTARNLGTPPALPLAPPLFRMLLADLYEGRQGQRPSHRFAELQQLVRTPELATPLDEVASLLSDLDRMEDAVRAADSAALVAAIAGAQAIDRKLRALLPSSRPAKSRNGKGGL